MTDLNPCIVCGPPVSATMFKHQRDAYELALSVFGYNTDREPGGGAGLLFEMGCGKTLTALAIAGRLYLDGHIDRLLIVAPTSVCAVWPEEFGRFADFEYECAVLLGTAEQRRAALAKLGTNRRKGQRLLVAVINYESTWRLEDALSAWRPDMIICDESQRIKSERAAQSKCMWRLGDRARFRLILSGTPMQNSPLDFWSQYRFLNPTIFGTRFMQFRGRYAIMGGIVVNGRPRQVVGYRNLDELTRKAYSIACRVTKADALDLPEQTFERRPVMLSSKEMSVYRAMQRDSLAYLGEREVTATNVLSRMLRLQQITGGFIRADDDEAMTMIGDSKLQALDDIVTDYVQEEGKKLVVFARFIPEVSAICAMLETRRDPVKYACIYGDVKQRDRPGEVERFQNDPECMVFVAQIDTAGLGITLHAASCAVLYSVNFNYAAYQQALARIHRIGQWHPCHYIHLVAPGTIDEHVLQALEKKEDLADKVVNGWKRFFEEDALIDE